VTGQWKLWYGYWVHGSSAAVTSLVGTRLAAALVFGSTLLIAPSRARADVSSWIYTGFGPALLDIGREDERQRWTLQIDTGLGSSPAPLVIGGLFRIQPYFGEGIDLALLARVASGGFVQGGWGLALDAGGYHRFWDGGSSGGIAALAIGAPWGIVLSTTGSLGSRDQRSGSVTLGIDFARLTVYRTSGTQWFMNPFATDAKGRGPR
jgi:hypothetical protein